MAGNKKISELSTISTIDAGAYLPIVDPTEVALSNQNKKVLVSQLDSRYISVTQYPILFNNEFSGKTTDELSEGGINKYYTDARVEANTEVAQNTTQRHNALSLTPDTVNIGLDDVNQVLEAKDANHLNGGVISSEDWVNFHSKQDKLAPASAIGDGFLSASDWNIFNNKVSKSPQDQDEQIVTGVAQNQIIPVDIAGLVLDPNNTFSFSIMMSVLVTTAVGTDLYRVLWLKGIKTSDSGLVMMSNADQDQKAFGNLTGFYFGINPITGQLNYTSSTYADFSSAEIRYRVFTTSNP